MLLKVNLLFAPYGKKNRALLVFLWIAYAIVTAFLISNHVPWVDEAFVWLIAREVGWWDICREAAAHHSPSLWYYILAVPAKLGLPYWIMQVLHWLGACLAVGIFLFRSPFSILFKAAFIFSFYIAYEHAVVARVYMLTLLLMWSACWCYVKRYKRPVLYGFIIALLAHTSFYGILAAIFFGADFCFSRKVALTRRQWCAFAIMLLAILMSLYVLMLDEHVSSFYRNFFPFFRLDRMHDMFYCIYFSPSAGDLLSPRINSIFWLIVPLLGALYGILTLWCLQKRKAYSFMVFLVLSWLIIIYIIVFYYLWPSPRHYSFYLMYAVMFLWLGKVRCPGADSTVESFFGLLLVLAFSFGVLGTVAQGYRDLRLPYSGSKKMAEYLMEHGLDNKILAVEHAWPGVSILPYMPKASVWDPRTLKFVRYPPTAFGSMIDQRMNLTLSLIDKYFGFHGPKYLICEEQVIVGREARRLKLLYFADGQTDKFWLYRVIP